MVRAAVRLRSRCSFKHSSRRRPSEVSTRPFCCCLWNDVDDKHTARACSRTETCCLASRPPLLPGKHAVMRTIIEINNDSARTIRDGRPDLADLLALTLVSGSDAAWDKLRPFGIKRFIEQHPTAPPKVVVGECVIAIR